MFFIVLGIFMMTLGFALHSLCPDDEFAWVTPTLRILVYGGSCLVSGGLIYKLFT